MDAHLSSSKKNVQISDVQSTPRIAHPVKVDGIVIEEASHESPRILKVLPGNWSFILKTLSVKEILFIEVPMKLVAPKLEASQDL